MKKITFILSMATFAALTSCTSDSASDNLPDNAKFIQSVHYVNTNEMSDEMLTVNYNTDGTIANVSDGTESSVFVYDSGNLTTVTGSSDNLSISEVYQAPYDGYEFGQVLDYDNNGNPTQLQLFERDEEGFIIGEYTGEITYDPQANPFLHTLDAGGILDVLDNVDVNFSAVPTSPELVAASQLLFVNNPKTFTLKNADNVVIATVAANYVYDAEGYPTSATFTSTDSEGMT